MPNNSKGLTSAYNAWGSQMPMRNIPPRYRAVCKKRVAIARAIALNPKYLFCDEPNSGLDPRTSILIDELLSDITHEYGITTIINTHDMNSVLGIGEKIVFINKGHCDWIGNDKTIFRSTSQSLNDFVFASQLFQEVKKFLEREYEANKNV